MELAIGKVISLILALIVFGLLIGFIVDKVTDLNIKCIGGDDREECKNQEKTSKTPVFFVFPVFKIEIFKRLFNKIKLGENYVK